MDKGDRKQQYIQKKMHAHKHQGVNKAGLTEQENDLIDYLSSADPDHLYKFFDIKYDKLIATNEKLFSKIYSTSSKRAKSYVKQFEDEQKQKFTHFVKKHTNQGVTQQQLKEAFAQDKNKSFTLKDNELIAIRYIPSKQCPGYVVMEAVLLDGGKPTHARERYYVKGIQEHVIHDVDPKRFKKDIIQMLQAYIDARAKAEKALQQELE